MEAHVFEAFKARGPQYAANNKALKKKLRQLKPKALDQAFHEAHEQVFAQTNCLACANCCKTTSPIFYQADIERVARALKMKVPVFIDTYLHLDAEGDYVLNQAPCPFLGHDNKCIVYESRPTACREYPHTNRKRMHQILSLTLKNAEVCPAVFNILERFKAIDAV